MENWKNIKNKIIGVIYACSFMNTAPVADIMNLLTNIINNCGHYNKNYEINNVLLHSIIAGTSPRYKFIVQSHEEYMLATIAHNIIYHELSWDSDEYRNSLIEMIFSVIDDTTKESLAKYVTPLTEPTEKLPEEKPSELVSSLYGLIKFILTKEEIPRSISLLIEEITSSQHVNKTLTTALIAITIGYNTLYETQPFFQARDKVDTCIRIYLKYLIGEKKRTLLGTMTFAKDNKIVTIKRYMHPPNMPTPGGPWHENILPPDMTQLAKQKRVSYIESDTGVRYQNALQFANKFYEGNIKFPDKIIQVDKEIILSGINTHKKDDNIVDRFF